ncbi:Mu transposase C-terminal domain-containing protein [Glutamicibacter creatinolyticus]|uniref:Mu transposase C-terminal domain-containing protein n=1 Tax=Glutamicibacter creatinolyticus TaxID=162496 RepID=UPI0031D9D689
MIGGATLGYDPRDVSEIRVYNHDTFICVAIDEAHPNQRLTLQEIETARRARRRQLRQDLNDRIPRTAPGRNTAPPPRLPGGRSCAPTKRTSDGQGLHRHQGTPPLHRVRHRRAQRADDRDLSRRRRGR